MRKVIIAGGRELPTPSTQEQIEWWLRKAFELFPPDVVLCGDCRGIDKLGERIATDLGIPVEHYPAHWGIYGNAAGPIRNEEMAKNGTELWIVWDGLSRGSRSMIELAKRYGLPVLEYNINSTYI